MLLQAVEREDLAVLRAVVGNGIAAVHDHPVVALAAKDQREPHHLGRKIIAAAGQVDVKEGGGDHHAVGQVLQRDVEHLDADAAGHLGKVLPGDADPFLAVVDQLAPAARVAGEVLAETLGQALIPSGVHLDVFVEQLTNFALSIWVHGVEDPGVRDILAKPIAAATASRYVLLLYTALNSSR